jgi:hypothetical protein
MLAAALLAAFGTVAHRDARAEESVSPPEQLVELERAFWICDHAATTRGVEDSTAIICFAVTDRLKDVKFGGDFEELVEWWRQHKPFEHADLDRREQSLARR